MENQQRTANAGSIVRELFQTGMYKRNQGRMARSLFRRLRLAIAVLLPGTHARSTGRQERVRIPEAEEPGCDPTSVAGHPPTGRRPARGRHVVTILS